MGSEGLSLPDNTCHLVIGKADIVAVFRSPAAFAAAVAGACGIHENEERYVAFIDVSVLPDGLCSVDSGAETEGKSHLFEQTAVKVTQKAHGVVVVNALAL